MEGYGHHDSYSGRHRQDPRRANPNSQVRANSQYSNNQAGYNGYPSGEYEPVPQPDYTNGHSTYSTYSTYSYNVPPLRFPPVPQSALPNGIRQQGPHGGVQQWQNQQQSFPMVPTPQNPTWGQAAPADLDKQIQSQSMHRETAPVVSPPPATESGHENETSPIDEDAKKATKKPVILVGKRRGGKILPTGNLGVTKKPRTESEQGRSDAWSRYMAEVKHYKDRSCEEDRKNRPLVK